MQAREQIEFDRQRKEAMFDLFDREHKRAKRELKQLNNLWYDVCWYNFETQCRSWRDPWHPSLGASYIDLHGHSFMDVWVNGRLVEMGKFPTWYSGAVSDAPPLPPEILLNEIDEAKKYVEITGEQKWAPYEYAPGGSKYQQLLREGEGVKAFYALKQSSETRQNGEPDGARGPGH